MTIINANCLTMGLYLAENSVDAIVTDPPYELGFMGKAWDASGIANSVPMWREALRVLKPGGHLLAFSGSRTYHRMVCAIEDAGFEVRDQLFWCYGSGFPKSQNLDRERGNAICGCETSDDRLPGVRHESHNAGGMGEEGQDADVQQEVQREVALSGACAASLRADRSEGAKPEDAGRQQPGLEGRCDGVQEARQLQGRALREGAVLGAADGAKGWLHHGASFGDGPVVRDAADARGDGASHRPRPEQKCADEPRTVAGQPEPQARRAWPLCGGCGKPILPRGLGTALKPAHEPIVLARKPLAKGCTVAANVLAHGTGALNIDGCRVGTEGGTAKGSKPQGAGKGIYGAGLHGACEIVALDAGRWPANLIHDGSDEVLAGFPQDAGRFFYCAKASRSERDAGLGALPLKVAGGMSGRADGSMGSVSYGRNTHPTVKPTELMRYLCRLITPPGGTVLDLFAGSGSTGKAATLEGFEFIGFELSAEYAAIAEARIAACRS